MERSFVNRKGKKLGNGEGEGGQEEQGDHGLDPGFRHDGAKETQQTVCCQVPAASSAAFRRGGFSDNCGCHDIQENTSLEIFLGLNRKFIHGNFSPPQN